MYRIIPVLEVGRFSINLRGMMADSIFSSSSSSYVTRVGDLSVVGQLTGTLVRGSRWTLSRVGGGRRRHRLVIVMVCAVVGVVLGGWLCHVQGPLPVSTPSVLAVTFVVVMLMLRVFIIDYLCVSRLILL